MLIFDSLIGRTSGRPAPLNKSKEHSAMRCGKIRRNKCFTTSEEKEANFGG